MVPEVPKFVFPIFRIFFLKKKFFLIFWPLLGHFLVQQKFLITPILAPGQFTTENKAILGPNQQFFLRQKFDRKGVINHQNIFGECSLGSKDHLIFLTLTPPWPPPHPPGGGGGVRFLDTSLVGQKKRLFMELKTPNMAHQPKSRFFQSPRYRYPNPTTEKET